MKQKITDLIKESIQIKNYLLNNQVGNIEAIAKMMISTIKSGNKILVFGNGGSASDSMHIAAELVVRFRKERPAFPCIALSTNPAILTAIGNDYTFESIFERQIEALGKRGDMALGISTSGRSKNVIRGIQKASSLKLRTAVLVGNYKEKLSRIADISIRVPSTTTPRIQEAHITIAHILCELIEDAF